MTSRKKQLHELNVLFLDENADMRHMVRDIARSIGVNEVDVVPNAYEAWRAYSDKKKDIDVILVDWGREDASGLEFTKNVRRHQGSRYREIPIIIMTSFTNKERVIKARDAGITEFLIKPFAKKDLKNRIRYVIEKPREFIESENYVGPDRRRRDIDVEVADLKRREDKIKLKMAQEKKANG